MKDRNSKLRKGRKYKGQEFKTKKRKGKKHRNRTGILNKGKKGIRTGILN